jgi:hypothetical protein
MTASFYQQIQQYSDNTALPPVAKWNPPLSGDMQCVIKQNGDWWLDGTPIKRPALIRLYSTVLKKEANDYFLVTPVEKWQITVEDLPFVITEISVTGSSTTQQRILARTNVGDWVTIDKDHPIASSKIANAAHQTAVPYVFVRDNLCARFNRNSYNDLAQYLQPNQQDPQRYDLRSADNNFLL